MNKQNGYKFYGGPLHGNYLQLEEDPGEYFEVEEYSYEDSFPFSCEAIMPKHVYQRRYSPDEQVYAYYLTDSGLIRH